MPNKTGPLGRADRLRLRRSIQLLHHLSLRSVREEPSTQPTATGPGFVNAQESPGETHLPDVAEVPPLSEVLELLLEPTAATYE
jgi:hypothetical protein